MFPQGYVLHVSSKCDAFELASNEGHYVTHYSFVQGLGVNAASEIEVYLVVAKPLIKGVTIATPYMFQ